MILISKWIVLITYLFSCVLYSKTNEEQWKLEFVDSFLKNDDLSRFVKEDEYDISKRLNIHYKNVRNKFLIANDLDKELKSLLNNEVIKYSVVWKKLDTTTELLKLNIPSKNISRDFILQKGKIVSKPYYYAINWKRIESKYFIFFVSNENYFHPSAIERLDEFVEKMIDCMGLSQLDKNLLASNKIYYFLCEDENEVELLTGYKSRGQYNLAYDYVISSYTCHYHEVLHLLINYKIKNNELFTHPFFQEGFAVAFGGRGGKEPEVILQMGNYLVRNNFVDVIDLLSKEGFYQHDASISYPVSGLYSRFLVDELGFSKYMEFYKKFSGSPQNIDNMFLNSQELPAISKWQNYIKSHFTDSGILVSDIDETKFKNVILKTDSAIVKTNSNEFLFYLNGKLKIYREQIDTNYTSKLFFELYPGNNYSGEEWMIDANETEISVYNLFTNNLAAKFILSFSTKGKRISKKENHYLFRVSKNVIQLKK